MISWQEARELIAKTPVRVGELEWVALDEAAGRTAARDIVARHDQPAEARSTMDGIAIAGAYPDVGDELVMLPPSHAGGPLPAGVAAGQAVPIATGAVVPNGTTLVIPKENYRRVDGVAVIELPGSGQRYIRDAGADFRQGEILVTAGQEVDARTLGLIAAANQARVDVVRRPRVLVVTTGDELIAPGEALTGGKTVDSVSHLLKALLADWGGDPKRHPTLQDEPERITAALGHAADTCDLVVMIGGASVGVRDYSRPAAIAAGYELLFERVNMQPGRPCWFARHPGGTVLMGLPGNPASAFVCAELFVRPLLRRLLGQEFHERVLTGLLGGTAPLRAGPRTLFARASASIVEGRLLATPLGEQDSGLQRVLAEANALIEVPPDDILHPGGPLELRLIGDLAGAS